jgi:hypothetical protein
MICKLVPALLLAVLVRRRLLRSHFIAFSEAGSDIGVTDRIREDARENYGKDFFWIRGPNGGS